jgi:hypothetical protein
MSLMLDYTSVPFVRCINIGIKLMLATLVARNANEAVVGSGRMCIWQESGIRQFGFGALGRNLASVTMKVFFTFSL